MRGQFLVGRMADDERFMLESAPRGRHVFKAAWTSWTGQILKVYAEAGNAQDKYMYTVATLLDDVIIGHVPHEFSQIQCSLALSAAQWVYNL